MEDKKRLLVAFGNLFHHNPNQQTSTMDINSNNNNDYASDSDCDHKSRSRSRSQSPVNERSRSRSPVNVRDRSMSPAANRDGEDGEIMNEPADLNSVIMVPDEYEPDRAGFSVEEQEEKRLEELAEVAKASMPISSPKKRSHRSRSRKHSRKNRSRSRSYERRRRHHRHSDYKKTPYHRDSRNNTPRHQQRSHGRRDRYALPERMVVILRTSAPISEKKWRRTIMDLGCKVYDHTYPYRLAARTILRDDRNGPRTKPMPVEKFAQFLCGQTSSFFGPKYIVDYFVDWYKKQPRSGSRVVVCGLGNDEPSSRAIDTLRSMGAVVVSEPGILGDFTASSERDLGSVFSQIRSEFRV